MPKSSRVLPQFGPAISVSLRLPFRWPAALSCLLVLLGNSVHAGPQSTIHVPKDQSTIQAGINAANGGDTVMVAPGVYSEAIDFRGKAIAVESSAGPATTIIDGTNQAFAVTFQSNETRSSILSGFTVQNGGTPTTTFQSNSRSSLTGGIRILNGAAPSIIGNTITHNACTGIFAGGGAPLIQNNEISYNFISANSQVPAQCADNSIGVESSYWYVSSAVVYESLEGQAVPSLPAVVTGNMIENNTIATDGFYGFCGAGTRGGGGGNESIIENNIVRNNAIGGIGGGLCIDAENGNLIVAQNLIYGNHAVCSGGGMAYEGPVVSYGPPIQFFVNNLIAGNSADYSASCNEYGTQDLSLSGSQITMFAASLGEFANNIVVGNDTHPAFYIFDELGLDEIFDHNDIFNPKGTGFSSEAGLIPDPTGSYGNISADPLFANAASNDYHLQSASPAIDAGNNSALQQLENSGLAVAVDFDGNSRLQDATGKAYPIVDMGPYEYAGAQETGSTTILLTPSSYNPQGGANIALTTELVSPNGTPTGSATFYANGSSIGLAPINGSGSATLNTPPLAPGLTGLLAIYPGQGNFTPAASVEVLIFVEPYQPTFTLASAPNPSLLNQSVTFTATITTPYGMPTGNLQFTDNGMFLGLMPIGANGVATFTTSSLTAGSHDIETNYGGNIQYGKAQAGITQTVLNNLPVQETLTSSLNPSLRNQSVTFTATVSSTHGTPSGTIVFSDGSQALGMVALTNGGAAFTTSALGKGIHTIAANYSGDADFANSSASVTQVVNGLPTAATVVSVSPARPYALEPAYIAAKVTAQSGIPTGTVTFMNGSSSIGMAPLNANGTATLTYAFPTSGNQTVTATYSADANFAASTSAALAVNVVTNDSETSLAVTPSPVLVYHKVSLTAAISSASASTFGVAPSGSVKFYDGATFIGTVTLNSSGVATISYSFTQEGNHGLSAVYSGNTAFLPSQSSSQLIVVNPSPTTTTVTANYNPQGLGAPVTFSATVSAGSGATAFPSGVATFYDGANTLGTVTLDATGTAKFTISTLALGQHPITASFASSTVYFLPSISSAYAENIVVAIGDFSISASSASQALYTGEATKSVTITLTSSGSWDQNVILACSQLPANTTCTFTPTSVLGANGASQLVIQTTAPHQVTSTASAENSLWPHKTGLAIAALALIFIPFRRRSSQLQRIFGAFSLAVLFAVMNGCGTPTDVGGTPPGVYNIVINATFSEYGATLTHSTVFTLTVKSLF